MRPYRRRLEGAKANLSAKMKARLSVGLFRVPLAASTELHLGVKGLPYTELPATTQNPREYGGFEL